MAEQPNQQQPQPGPSKRKVTIVLWVSVCLVGVVILAWPTVMLFFFGMLPTIVAYLVDRTQEKYATFCVASMNFCGVFPYMMELWMEGHTTFIATEILADVFSLVIIYGAAAFGWVIFTSVPPVVASFLSVIAQQRVSTLRLLQRKLIEEWGEAVAHQASPASITAATTATAQTIQQDTKNGTPSGHNDNGSGTPPDDKTGTPPTQASAG